MAAGAQVLGHGIDLIELDEFRQLIEKANEQFIPRCFTPSEQGAAGDGVLRTERLAARFAAKEAVLKALGTGWADGIAWTDVEIQTLESGRPQVKLYGGAAAAAAEYGITKWIVSLTHTRSFAAASAIALGVGDTLRDQA